MHKRKETTVLGIVQGQGDVSMKKMRVGLEEPQQDQVADDDALLRPGLVCSMILVSTYYIILTEVM